MTPPNDHPWKHHLWTILVPQKRQNVYGLVDSTKAKASYLGVVSFGRFVPDSDSGSVTMSMLIAMANFFLFFILLRHKSRVTTTAWTNCCGPVVRNPPCQLSLWEETGVPGENPRLSAELTILFSHEDWVRVHLTENKTRNLGGLKASCLNTINWLLRYVF